MFKLLSRNKLIALIFVVALLFGVYVLVGTEREGGAITAAADQIEARAREAQESRTPDKGENGEAQDKAETEFVPDEELIGDAEGIPPDGFSAEGFDSSGDDASPVSDAQPDVDPDAG